MIWVGILRSCCNVVGRTASTMMLVLVVDQHAGAAALDKDEEMMNTAYEAPEASTHKTRT